MFVFDLSDIICVVLLAVGIILFFVAFIIDRISCAIKKRQQKRIDNAFEEEGE